MSKMVEQEALNGKIIELNFIIKELKDGQKKLEETLEKNHSVNMAKLNKLHEYNKIIDMTNVIFEKRISSIEVTIKQILNKLSA